MCGNGEKIVELNVKWFQCQHRYEMRLMSSGATFPDFDGMIIV